MKCRNLIPLLVFASIFSRCAPIEDTADIQDSSQGESAYINQPPVFIGKSVHILDLSVDKSIAFKVAVKDDDSVAVELVALKYPEGSFFEVASPKSVYFFWKPTPSQIEESSFYFLVIRASDGENPPVIYEIGIMLINSDDFDFCPGVPPLAVVSGIEKKEGSIEVTLQAVDEDSGIKKAEVFYTETDPSTGNAPFEKIEMMESHGGVFTASMKQPSALPPVLYFYFTVTDDDDMLSDYCDHSRRIPKRGFLARSVSTCGIDSLEPNDEPEDALSLEPGITLPNTLITCKQERDYFKFFLKKNEKASFYLDTGMGLSPDKKSGLALEIRNGEDLLLKSAQGDFIEFIAPESGYYFLSVSAHAFGEFSYSIHMYSSEEPCVPVDFSLSSKTEIEFELCTGEKKVFDVFLDRGNSFNAEISYDSGGGDIDTGLFMEGVDFPLAVSNRRSGRDSIKFDANATGLYKFVLAGQGGTGNRVKLTAAVKSIADACSDDLFSPNHTEESAVMLVEGDYMNLKLCPGFDDYFATGLNGGEELSLFAESWSEPDNIFTLIYNPDGSECGESVSEGSHSLSFCKAVEAGEYILRVYSKSNYKLGYDFGFVIEEPPYCNPDRLEFNNSPKSASQIPEGFTSNLTLCEGDTDFFLLNLPAMSLLSAYLFAEDAISFSLLSNKDFSVLKEGVKSSYGAAIFYLVPKSGKYLLKVAGEGKGVYDLGYIIESP